MGGSGSKKKAKTEKKEGGEPAAAPAPAAGKTNKDNPKYTEYFKMLRIGVPVPQIKAKMAGAGCSAAEQDLIDHPDDPWDGK